MARAKIYIAKAPKSLIGRRRYRTQRSSICALCFAEMALARQGAKTLDRETKSYSEKAASGPSHHPEASSTKATKRLASSTPADPRNGRNWDFFVLLHAMMLLLDSDPRTTVLEGDDEEEGKEDPRHLQGVGCPADEVPAVVGLCDEEGARVQYAPWSGVSIFWGSSRDRQAVNRAEAAIDKSAR